jgi:hypothetical protein
LSSHQATRAAGAYLAQPRLFPDTITVDAVATGCSIGIDLGVNKRKIVEENEYDTWAPL